MSLLLGLVLIAGALAIAIGRRWLPRWYVRLILVGALIGSAWEIAFTFLHMGYPVEPGGGPAVSMPDITDLPLAAILPMLALVSLADGALFVAGLALARLVLGARLEQQFDWRALAIMELWGQLQSLFVETRAIDHGMWAYRATPWNPALGHWGAAQLTLWPQLVWLLGYALFYAAVLRLSPRGSAPAPRSAA